MGRIIMLMVNDACGYCGTSSNMDTVHAFVNEKRQNPGACFKAHRDKRRHRDAQRFR